MDNVETLEKPEKITHPRGLYSLFFTEMWERFSYYGMRALLIIYLTTEYTNGGFGLGRASALEIYATFTGFVYLTPILGGMLADKFLGQRRAIYTGGLLMAFGQFALAASHIFMSDESQREFYFYLGLGLLIVGNGFFKPNISTIVGTLYGENDRRKDSAFTIFYMGINLGAFLAPIICGFLAEEVGWKWGFATAGMGMLLACLWFYIEEPRLQGQGMPPGRVGEARLNLKDYIPIAGIVVASVLLVLDAVILIEYFHGWDFPSTLFYAIVLLGVGGLGYIIYTGTNGSKQWSGVIAILIFTIGNVIFWSGFEQAGSTLNLFAAEETDRSLFSFEIPASWFQSVNALAIFIFAPVFASLWVSLANRKLNPSTPIKFGMGLVMLFIGFVVMSFASFAAEGEELVSPMWLVGVYVLHTFGELCLSPIGLSLVSKLAPPKIVSVMMGLWFASMAIANFLAGNMESYMDSIKPYMEFIYPGMNLYEFLTLTSAAGAVLMFALTPILRKLMRDVQ